MIVLPIILVFNVWNATKIVITKAIKLSLKGHMEVVVTVVMLKLGKRKVFVANIQENQFKYRLIKNKFNIFC